jgi:dGTPase
VAALETLFLYFCEHPETMPPLHAELANHQPRHRVVCDYIAGMTDRFLQQEHHRLLA